MIAQCEERLAPATLKQGKAELGACLTLVSPSGLTADDRREWLAVAMATLSGIPADLLAQGCERARKTCRFPSEIVPTILSAVERQWAWRKEDLERRYRQLDALNQPRLPDPEYVGAQEIRKLIKAIGQ
jgi:hypothetical protein